ncbi:MAG: PorV/PorQ family protein [Candidatus Edwardsbacteria bacterium]|nr:PorV/PorQ family protein [Candidatus Edwardsbacteria bacterium]
MNKAIGSILGTALLASAMLSAMLAGRQCLAAKYAGEFAYLGLGARALAMGGAYVALADDGFSCYWNPAGAVNGAHQAMFMHSSTFDGLVNYDAAGYSRPLAGAGCGIALFRLSVKEIPFTDGALLDLNQNNVMDTGERLDYDKISFKTDNEWFLLANYGRNLWGCAAGANLKLVYKSIGSNAAWGFGLDAGVLREFPGRLKVGLNVMDLTTTYLAWNTGRRELIAPTCRPGLSWQPQFKDSAPLILSASADFRFEGRAASAQYHIGSASADFHLGSEYWIKERLALRLGLDQGRFAAGAGLRLGRFNFDYAFLGSAELGNSTRISGSCRF